MVSTLLAKPPIVSDDCENEEVAFPPEMKQPGRPSIEELQSDAEFDQDVPTV